MLLEGPLDVEVAKEDGRLGHDLLERLVELELSLYHDGLGLLPSHVSHEAVSCLCEEVGLFFVNKAER